MYYIILEYQGYAEQFGQYKTYGEALTAAYKAMTEEHGIVEMFDDEGYEVAF